jgi:thiamine-monophosphate kinase
LKLCDLGEFGFIERIQDHSVIRPHGVVQGIGDDCAVLSYTQEEHLLVTMDMLIEGVHFRRDLITYYQLGWKTLAVNLSDIAAMAGTPRDAFIGLAVPPEIDLEDLEAFYKGFKDLARRYGVNLLGGDTSRSPDHMMITVTLTGTVPADRILYRRGARAGDWIAVTGHLGDAAAGLQIVLSGNPVPDEIRAPLVKAHLTPEPHLEEARLLASLEGVHAAIDVSDGLSMDVRHLCTLGRIGAVIDEVGIPISRSTRYLASKIHVSAEDLALHGGEDYVLLVAIAPDSFATISQAFEQRFRKPLYHIGSFCVERQVALKTSQGVIISLPSMGYDHFRSNPSHSTG